MCIADVTVQRSLRPQQIHGIILTRIPQDGTSVHIEGNTQNLAVLLRSSNGGTHLITECQAVGLNDKVTVLCSLCKTGNRQPTVDNSKGSPVLEFRGAAILNTYKTGCKDCESCPAAYHNGSTVGLRIPLLIGKTRSEGKHKKQRNTASG